MMSHEDFLSCEALSKQDFSIFYDDGQVVMAELLLA